MAPNVEENFLTHLTIIRSHFGTTQTVCRNGVTSQVYELVNSKLLGIQQGFFKLTMKANSAWAMEEPMDVNLVTKLWTKLSTSSLLGLRMSEFFRLAEIVMATMIGSVEDERTFNTLTFMKSKLRNRLGLHLNCMM